MEECRSAVYRLSQLRLLVDAAAFTIVNGKHISFAAELISIANSPLDTKRGCSLLINITRLTVSPVYFFFRLIIPPPDRAACVGIITSSSNIQLFCQLGGAAHISYLESRERERS
jgi:hypothetical protein